MPTFTPSPRRTFEDLTVGETVTLGQTTVTRESILAFATEFDPLPFHLDEAAAKASLLGGLAASGWQTAALSQRLLHDGLLTNLAAVGVVEVRDLKWSRPVLVGDTISGTATVARLDISTTPPACGVVTIKLAIVNQRNEPVMRLKLTNLVETRSIPTPQQPYDVERTPGGSTAP
ncbi:MaoC family dehydratase [Devosia sp.]|uniref:MaoC family dehydratase n=1 Tax=Devosia sp. TaxID=1871048 RepID=UPI003BAD120C